VYPISVFP